MRVPCDRISMSVQEYLSPASPHVATRWMGMRRALLALALAAAVTIAGVAAYVYMYEGSLDVAVRDDSGAWAHVWVTFDINLARSIVANGSSWTFTPVLGQITVA